MAGNEEIIEQVSQYTVSKTISKCLRSLNGGSIRIDIENQPFLKLTINQENINVLNLEFGEKGDAFSGSNGNGFWQYEERVKVFLM